MKRRRWIIALALVLGACGGSATDEQQRPAGGGWTSTTDTAADDFEVLNVALGRVPNVTRYGSIWFAGQPGKDDWQAVRESGIKKVIDLRNRNEGRGYDQRAILKGLNLDYSVHPVRADDYARSTVEPVLDAMTAAQNTGDDVLVHCASSNRSGALLAIWRYRRGDSLEEALAAGKEAGMTSEEASARAYIEEHGR